MKMEKHKVKKEYFSIADLSDYTGISERTLRDLLKDPVNPIPYFRIGPAGRIIRVKRSDFDEWMKFQRATQGNAIDELIAEVLQ